MCCMLIEQPKIIGNNLLKPEDHFILLCRHITVYFILLTQLLDIKYFIFITTGNILYLLATQLIIHNCILYLA